MEYDGSLAGQVGLHGGSLASGYFRADFQLDHLRIDGPKRGDAEDADGASEKNYPGFDDGCKLRFPVDECQA